MKITLLPNRKTRFTRKCIAEAIIILLKDTPFEKLKVSAIIKKAGIARMTFYKHYDSPKAALIDYLQIMISEYMEQFKGELNRDTFMSYDRILNCIVFFDQYSDFFLTMAKNDLHGILINGINQFLVTNIETSEELSKYEIYAYGGGLLNTFLNWEANGKKDSAEEVAQRLYALYGK